MYLYIRLEMARFKQLSRFPKGREWIRQHKVSLGIDEATVLGTKEIADIVM